MKKLIAEFQQQVVSLQKQIQLLKNGRKSNTSSTPPLQDYGRSNQKSLRTPSSRKTGEQSVHEGTTLQMKEIPHKVTEHRPNYCRQCGVVLDANEMKMVSRKQEIILPPIVPQYVEHQSYACTCKTCGFVTTAELPEYLKANVQYSQTVSAWVAYLSVRQYLSYERIAEFMKGCCNISKPIVATTSLAGCFGCHMSIPAIDERILQLIDLVDFNKSPIDDIKEFTQMCDIGIIEGGCCNSENVHVLKDFRKNCKILISCDECAIMGGLPALSNNLPIRECLEEAYLNGPSTKNANPDGIMPNIEDFMLTPIDESAKVTFTTHAASPGYIVNLCRKMYKNAPDSYLLHIKGYEWEFREGLSERAKLNLEKALESMQAQLKYPDRIIHSSFEI